jgi:hypothetical protein
MKSILTILMLSLLVGCSTTVPVARKFPDLPPSLEKSCEPLKEVAQTDKLSQVLITITDNYSLYHECEIKNELWLKWYHDQKEIFDSVK